MRTSVSLFWLAILALLISQLGFLLNAQVLYSGYLSSVGVAIGLAAGIAVYWLKKYKNQQSMYILEEDTSRIPWYKQVFQTEWVFTICISAGMLAASLLNNVPVVFDTYQQSFYVTGHGERFFRANARNYVELTNGDAALKYISERSFAHSDEVMVTLRTGLLGFPVLVEVESETDA